MSLQPNVDPPVYEPQNFRDLFETELGRALWRFLMRPENVIRMETATFLERAAVEPLSPGLLVEFGPDVSQDRIKQMIGHMVRQIMAARGYEVDRSGLRIMRAGVFTTGARYRVADSSKEPRMKITSEQRQAWIEKTSQSPFNRWLSSQIKDKDGKLDLERLYSVARRYGIEKRYDHLNPGQQRMNIGVMLRARVPNRDIVDF